MWLTKLNLHKRSSTKPVWVDPFIKSVCVCVRLWQESKYHKSMIQSGSGSEANKRATLEQSPFTFLVEYYVATPHPKDRMYVRACDCVCVLVSFLFF